MEHRSGQKYDDGFYKALSGGSVQSAKLILCRLYSVYHPTSVVDFGCGLGAWLSVAEEMGSITLKGYDGSWVNEEKMLSKNIDFSPVDLNCEVPLDRRFDLCISVEVAEHLDPNKDSEFIKLLCSSSDIVLFSAAIKGQGGTDHINEQWQSYWINLFSINSFQSYDIFRGALWNDKRVAWLTCLGKYTQVK